MLKVVHKLSSEYNLQKVGCLEERRTFKQGMHSVRAGTSGSALPAHLQGPIPTFTTWLKNHVDRLRHEEFIIPTTVVNLSSVPNPMS